MQTQNSQSQVSSSNGSEDWRTDSSLPQSVRGGLEQLCDQLEAALGERLISIILYGGLAKGEYAPQSSDVNVMLVLTEVTIETLDKAAAPVRQATRDFGLSVMVFAEDGLGRSMDIFPIKFLDMQRHHRVLWGKGINLSVAEDHLRLRCKQEIKNLSLRLRSSYLQRSAHSELLEATLTHGISSFVMGLSALLFLKTGDTPTAKRDIAEAAVRELGLEEKPLSDVFALKLGEYKPDALELKRLYGAFMATVERAADIADQH
ncbi:MAG: hypothetical protein V3U60_08635 [Gammaproteobacteria bacterium]